MTGIKRIATHSGPFHCDEVLACVILKILPEYQNSEIVRTRDPSNLDSYDIVLDTGGTLDHVRKRYDHHQPGFDQTLKSISGGKLSYETKLSSAGLIFWFYGKQAIAKLLNLDLNKDWEHINFVFDHVYKELIQEIDEIDNNGGSGHSKTDITSRVAKLRPKWDDECRDYDNAFVSAMDLVRTEFTETVSVIGGSDWRARLALREKIGKRHDDHESGRVLFFDDDKPVKWCHCLLELEREAEIHGKHSNILFVVSRTNENHYGIKTPYKRCPFPDKWRGLHERELEKVSDVPGAIFVHNGGYVAYAVDRSAALNMIDAAIAEDDRRKEAMSEILKKQEINDVVKSLRRMSVRAYK